MPKNNSRNLNIIILVAGRGSRLKPYTEILPKPLLPIDNKPVIKHILEKNREKVKLLQ